MNSLVSVSFFVTPPNAPPRLLGSSGPPSARSPTASTCFGASKAASCGVAASGAAAEASWPGASALAGRKQPEPGPRGGGVRC